MASWKAYCIDGIPWKSGAYSLEFNLKVVKRWCDACEATSKAGLQKRKQLNVNNEKRPVRAKRVPGRASAALEDLTYDQPLAAAGMARSSWYYRQAACKRPDKHADLKQKKRGGGKLFWHPEIGVLLL